MDVKIKKLTQTAQIPTKAHATDAGYDLYADSVEWDDKGNTVYGTGIAMEIPQGYVGLVFPRSSNSKKDLFLTNCVGVIDSGYRGEIKAKFRPTLSTVNPLKFWWKCFVRNLSNISLPLFVVHGEEYKIGDRIAQIIIIPYPEVDFVITNELSDSDRGVGGYGSSGE